MTKGYFIQLADYNLWANRIVGSWCNEISEEQWNQPIVSSFNGIGATVLHVASAENVWLERLRKATAPVWLQGSFKGNKQETLAVWLNTSEKLLDYLKGFDEQEMQTDLAFKRLNGQAYKMPHFEIFAHLFNHSSYHRGQIVTMMRQAGNTNVGSTDLLAFYSK